MRTRLLVFLVAFLAALTPTAPAGAQVEREPVDFDYVAGLDELTDDHARVLRLYWAAFDRVPDVGGALFWIDRFERCQPFLDIAAFFAASPEFIDTYGELDDAGFVEVIYRNVLDRDPDAGGRAFWEARLADGASRARVLADFSWSEEFTANHPLPSDGVPGRRCIGSGGPTDGERARSFTPTEWVPFAAVNGVTLRQPSAVVELIGYHQSNHDGAQRLLPLAGSSAWTTLDDRGRDTDRRGAADIVVHPLTEIRSPVTGTVVRAGGYTLYCDYRDDYVVIDPDDRPGYEVKVLHIDGVQVRAGDRVIAGETVLAPSARRLPFASQVDRLTGQPAWPHVHIEVVDPTIPDRPSTGGGC